MNTFSMHEKMISVQNSTKDTEDIDRDKKHKFIIKFFGCNLRKSIYVWCICVIMLYIHAIFYI